MKSIKLKLQLISILPLILIIVILSMINYSSFNAQNKTMLEQYKKDMVSEKQQLIKDKILNVERIIKTILLKHGNKSEKAKKTIIQFISKIRYMKNGSGYFFAYKKKSDGYYFAFHGVKKHFNNTKADIGYLDINGFAFRKALIENGTKDKFVSYFYQKPNTDRVIEKIAYSKYIKELGWTLVTGIYLDDVNEKIQKIKATNKNIVKNNLIQKIGIALILIILLPIIIASVVNKIMLMLKNTQEELELSSERTRRLLDNSAQGFLSFGRDLIVGKNYSRECLKFFKKDIADKNIANLLFSSTEKKEFFKDTLLNVIDSKESLAKEALLSLLPSEIVLEKRALKLEYKIIEDNRVMLILTNVTSQKILEKKIKKEQEILKMIVSVICDKNMFFEVKKDYENFAKKKLDFADSDKTTLRNLNELYRIIHTFKGTFMQLYMQQAANNLHNIETAISKLMKDKDITNNDLLTFLEDVDFDSFMQEDLEIIEDILKRAFLDNANFVNIDVVSVENIKNKIASYMKEETGDNSRCREILCDIRRLTGVKLITLFNSYSTMTLQLAKRLKKKVYKFEIIGDNNILLPNDKFKPFVKSLIHIFRNSVSHGIEDPETRIKHNKDETGTISCSFDIVDDYLQVIISDDGAGLNIEKIKQKLSSKNIVVDGLSDEELYKYIFDDNFSTADKISEISGRGVGMSAIKAELDKLNGVYEIQSKINVGTTIIFKIPTNQSWEQ